MWGKKSKLELIHASWLGLFYATGEELSWQSFFWLLQRQGELLSEAVYDAAGSSLLSVHELFTCILILFTFLSSQGFFSLFFFFLIDPCDLVSNDQQNNFLCNRGESRRQFCPFFLLVSAFYDCLLLLPKLFLANFAWLYVGCSLGNWLDCSWFSD